MALSKKKNNESKNMHFSREDQKKILSSSSPFIVKEAYSSIRTNLLFSQKGDECPVFIVTSPTANNGKSINSVNMAVSFAQMGKKTLLIDADMRNPTVHRLFSIPVKNGLSEILAGLTDTSPYRKQILKIFLFLRPAKFRQTRQSFYQVKERISFWHLLSNITIAYLLTHRLSIL